MVFMRKTIGLLLPPLLGVGLAVGLPRYLWVSGQLDNLSNAVMVGSSIVIAEFTLALWWATRRQAEVSAALGEINRRLMLAETTPFVYAPKVEVYLQEKEPITIPGEGKVNRQESFEMGFFDLSNPGKYGLVIKGIEILAYSSNAYKCVGREDINFMLPPGESKTLTAGFKGRWRPADWYQDEVGEERIPSLFEDFISGIIDGEKRSLVRFSIVYGGLPQEVQYACFYFDRARDVSPASRKSARLQEKEVLVLLPAPCPPRVSLCGAR